MVTHNYCLTTESLALPLFDSFVIVTATSLDVGTTPVLVVFGKVDDRKTREAASWVICDKSSMNWPMRSN